MIEFLECLLSVDPMLSVDPSALRKLRNVNLIDVGVAPMEEGEGRGRWGL